MNILAAGGIGMAISKHLASTGCKVTMLDIDPKLEEIGKSIEGEVAIEICDVRHSDQVKSAITNIEISLGQIDALSIMQDWSLI